MGRSEAPKLDSLAPNADSPLRQPRRFFLKLLLGGFTLGGLLLPLVAALFGNVSGMAVVLLLAAMVLLIPGNHDLCFNPIESPDLDRSRTAARRALFLTRAARIEGGPWAIKPGRTWRQVFPRMHTTRSGVHLFAFDTNGYGSRQTLSNAVGIFGDHALTHLERELARLTGPVVVMAHHHVARPLERSLTKDPFLIAVDARALLDILCRYNARDPEHNGVLVVHGHRHLDALTRYENHRGRVDIYSHPSSTLGHENKGHLDGVGRFASVWLDPRGHWLVKSHAVELCAATAQARVA